MMASWYPYIKYTHLFFVMCTFTLFNLRFWLRTMQPEKPLPVLLKVLPHINDSLLLFTGMLMIHIIPWKLFGDDNWLGTKLLLVLTYIVVGALCLRAKPLSKRWWMMYGVSMLTIGTVAYLAHWKPF